MPTGDRKIWCPRVVAAGVAGFALVRYSITACWKLVGLLAFLLALSACLQSVGAFDVPLIGMYLKKIPIEASVTLIGVLLAAFGAVHSWRRQKRDELLLSTLGEIQGFFEGALDSLAKVNSYVRLVRDLQVEVLKGPYNLDAYWNARFLSDQAQAMAGRLMTVHDMAVEVHSLDSRNVHAMTSQPGIFTAFKAAKGMLIELDDAAYMNLPPSFEDPHQFISYLRRLSPSEYDKFLRLSHELNPKIAGAVGGIRGAIQARFFPPTFTLARAVLRSHEDA